MLSNQPTNQLQRRGGNTFNCNVDKKNAMYLNLGLPTCCFTYMYAPIGRIVLIGGFTLVGSNLRFSPKQQ